MSNYRLAIRRRKVNPDSNDIFRRVLKLRENMLDSHVILRYMRRNLIIGVFTRRYFVKKDTYWS